MWPVANQIGQNLELYTLLAVKFLRVYHRGVAFIDIDQTV